VFHKGRIVSKISDFQPPGDGVDGVVGLDASLVPAQGVVARGAGVSHLVKTVNAARYAGTRPESHEAEDPTNDPGEGTGLGGGPGGDVLLAVRAHHGHCTVPKTWALHILDLGHHLHRGLGLHGLGGRGTTCLLW